MSDPTRSSGQLTPGTPPRLFRRLFEVSVAINGNLELREVLDEVALAARDLAGADVGTVVLWAAESGRFEPPEGESPASHWIVEHRAPLMVADAGRHELGETPIGGFGVVSAFCAVPIVHEDEVTGVIYALARGPGAFEMGAIPALESLATVAATAIRNARLVAGLREASEMREAMLRLAAHDIRRPLTAFAAHLELLEDNPEPGAEARGEWLRQMRSAVDAMEGLTDSVLGYERLAAGAAVMRTALDLNTLVEQAAMSASSTDADGKSRIHFEKSGTPLILAGDERLLHEAVGNLIDNALTHGQSDGVVTIRTWADGRLAAVEVLDSGPGIREADHERIFEPFVRLPEAARVDGSGLGLSLVKVIVEAHGGRVDVGSAPGSGAVFTMYLPLS